MNINFKVIVLTGLGIKSEFTVSEAHASTTRPSDMLIYFDTRTTSNSLHFMVE